MPYKGLYYGDPINRSHPLNRGLVGEWTVVPWYFSGPRFMDLTEKRHPATLNGSLWHPALGRPGGTGSLFHDGSNDFTLASGISAGTTYTVCCWAQQLANGFYSYMVGLEAGADSGLRFEAGDRQATFTDGAATATWSTAIPLGEWHFICGTTDDATLRVYVDGIERANVPAGRTSTPAEFCWGADRSGAQNYLNFRGDQGMLYNRVLSAHEIFQLYLETRNGNPTRWNWVEYSPWQFGFPPEGHFVMISARDGIVLAKR